MKNRSLILSFVFFVVFFSSAFLVGHFPKMNMGYRSSYFTKGNNDYYHTSVLLTAVFFAALVTTLTAFVIHSIKTHSLKWVMLIGSTMTCAICFIFFTDIFIQAGKNASAQNYDDPETAVILGLFMFSAAGGGIMTLVAYVVRRFVESHEQKQLWKNDTTLPQDQI